MKKLPYLQQILFEQDAYTVELCLESSSLRTAYEIRYHAYHHAETIPFSSEGIFRDQYDEQIHAQTYLIWHHQVPIASMRVCIWSPRYHWRPLESIKYFQSEIQNHIGLYQIMLESQHRVVRPEVVKQIALKVQILMIRILIIIGKAESSQSLLNWVNRSELPFFEKILAFVAISEPEYLFGWKEEIVLMLGNRDVCELAYQKFGGLAILKEDIDSYHRLRSLLTSDLG